VGVRNLNRQKPRRNAAALRPGRRRQPASVCATSSTFAHPLGVRAAARPRSSWLHRDATTSTRPHPPRHAHSSGNRLTASNWASHKASPFPVTRFPFSGGAYAGACNFFSIRLSQKESRNVLSGLGRTPPLLLSKFNPMRIGCLPTRLSMPICQPLCVLTSVIPTVTEALFLFFPCVFFQFFLPFFSEFCGLILALGSLPLPHVHALEPQPASEKPIALPARGSLLKSCHQGGGAAILFAAKKQNQVPRLMP